MSHHQGPIIKDNTRSGFFSFMSECELSLKMQDLGDVKEKVSVPAMFLLLAGTLSLSLHTDLTDRRFMKKQTSLSVILVRVENAFSILSW